MREDISGMIAGIDEPVELEDGKKRPAINFDNASTAPALLPVMKAVNDSLLMYGSVGRGFSQKSDYTTEAFEKCRRSILRFLNADVNEYCCVFVNNTTDGINKLASALITDRDDVVLLTRMEHHSNDLPWRERCRVLYAEVDSLGRIRYDEIERAENSLKVEEQRFQQIIEDEYKYIVGRRDVYRVEDKDLLATLEDLEKRYLEMRGVGEEQLSQIQDNLRIEKERAEERLKSLRIELVHLKEEGD